MPAVNTWHHQAHSVPNGRPPMVCAHVLTKNAHIQPLFSFVTHIIFRITLLSPCETHLKVKSNFSLQSTIRIVLSITISTHRTPKPPKTIKKLLILGIKKFLSEMDSLYVGILAVLVIFILRVSTLLLHYPRLLDTNLPTHVI